LVNQEKFHLQTSFCDFEPLKKRYRQNSERMFENVKENVPSNPSLNFVLNFLLESKNIKQIFGVEI